MFVVAGATGKTGGVVFDTLLARGKSVRVLVRDAAKAERFKSRGAEVVIGSLSDAATLTRALRGAEAFYTLLPEDPTSADFHGDRDRMAETIALAVKESGVPHVVTLSALAATMTDVLCPAHGLHHLEVALKKTGAAVTILRATYMQENVAMALPGARQSGVYPTFLPADLAIPQVASRDIGRVATDALLGARENVIIDVLGPTYSPRQLAEKLGDTLGKKLNIAEIPPQNHVGALLEAGVPRQYAEAVAAIFGALGSGRVLRPEGDRQVMCTTPIENTIAHLLGA